MIFTYNDARTLQGGDWYALELTRTSAVDIEYWPTADPSAVEGNRAQRLDAYREVREQLLARIHERFARPSAGNE